MCGPETWAARVSASLTFACLIACGRTEAPHPPAPLPLPPAASAAAFAPAASLDGAPVESVALPGVESWSVLVRDEKWDAAWSALEALADAERLRPEVKYVRARVALARGDAASALPLLEGLEASLPLLADDIARRRAEAKLAVGPYEEAAEWFSQRSSPASQLDAARAFEKARDLRRARAAADRVIAAEKRTRNEEAEARALRVRIADTAGDVERADARWLAIEGADLPASADSLALVAKVDPKRPLAAEDLMMRAKTLADGGRPDDALRAIELAQAAPGSDKVTRLTRERARGMILYRARGRWTEASRVLGECAAAGGPKAAEDAFYAARALSRADRDEEAIRAYEEVSSRYAKTTWADQAAFLAPYLRMLHGRWRECARGFDAYPRARTASNDPRDDSRDARRDGALCKLLAGDSKESRAVYEQLVEDEADPIVSARMADMAALAALRDGDRTHAVARWTDVARSRPLSWPALIARARLAETGAPIPPPIAPAEDPPEAGAPPLAIVLPAPADLLHQLGLEVDAEEALREREATITMGAGGRAPEVLCETYGRLERARRRYQIAQSLPSALFTVAPGPLTLWAWQCAFPSPYEKDVRAAESAEDLPRGLLWAVMRQESGYDPDAVSPAHAVGLMQLLPDTARPIADELALSRDDARLTSPPYAIAVGARALRKLLERFHGSVPLAVAAYNAGTEAVERWMSRAPGMQLDTFVERIPYKETRDYVARVLGNFARYGYLADGEAGVPKVELEMKGR